MNIQSSIEKYNNTRFGHAREAVKALIVANDFLENEVSELMRAVSQAYVRGRFKSYSG